MRISRAARQAAIVLIAAVPFAHLSAQADASKTVVSLKVGDPVPPLKVGRWLKGGAVPNLAKDQVYVVEFWATWCGPCKSNMPHMTALAKAFQGQVTIIGVDIMERGEPSAIDKTVDAFVKEMGPKMDYHVAQDTRDGYMHKSWFIPTGLGGIPACMVVDKAGRLAWIGHPQGLEPVLKKVLAGSFDLKESAAKSERDRIRQEAFLKAMAVYIPLEPELNRLRDSKDWDGVLAFADKTEASHADMDLLPRFFNSARVKALASKHPEQVKRFLDRMIEKKTGDSPYEEAIGLLMEIRDLDKKWSELGLAYLSKITPRDPNHEKRIAAQCFGFMVCLDQPKARLLFEVGKADEDSLREMLGSIIELEEPPKAWLPDVVKILEEWAKTPDGERYYQGLAKAYFGLGKFEEAVKAQEVWLGLLKKHSAPDSYMVQAKAELAKYQAAAKSK